MTFPWTGYIPVYSATVHREIMEKLLTRKNKHKGEIKMESLNTRVLVVFFCRILYMSAKRLRAR